jgi:hypothetical protein
MRGDSASWSLCFLILLTQLDIGAPILSDHFRNSIGLHLRIALDRGAIYRSAHMMVVELLLGFHLPPLGIVVGCRRPWLLRLFKAHLKMGSSLLIFHSLRDDIGVVGLLDIVQA